MDYDCIGVDACKKKLSKIPGFTIYGEGIDQSGKLIITGKINNKTDVRYLVNWPEYNPIENRAGLLLYRSDFNWKGGYKKRDFICNEPIRTIRIDYNGNVMPCCHARSDAAQHKQYILGNVYKETLVSIYSNPRNLKLINQIQTEPWEIKMCKNCQKPIS
jgi:radical SAM protein with 4Fe4S-binding SPASM domain